MAPFFEDNSLPQAIVRPGIFILLLIQAAQVFAAGQDEAVPIVVVDSPHKEFQSVMRGDLITERFTVRNAGGSLLKFEGVEMSHPGMKIRIGQKVEPGSSTEAVIEWDTQGIAGDLEGVAVILTNDPKQPRVNLTLRGQIVPPIQILPRPIFYLSQFHGEQTTTEFTIQNNQEKEVEIKRLELLGEHFEATFKAQEPGRKWSLIVTIPAGTAPGRFREALKIYTDDEQNPSLYVQVNVMVKPDVFVNPEEVDFGQVSEARVRSDRQALEFLTQTVVINRREGEMSIKVIESDIPFVIVRQEPESPSGSFRLDVKLNPELIQSGSFEGQIKLFTDDTEHSVITIPVRVDVLD